MSPLQI